MSVYKEKDRPNYRYDFTIEFDDLRHRFRGSTGVATEREAKEYERAEHRRQRNILINGKKERLEIDGALGAYLLEVGQYNAEGFTQNHLKHFKRIFVQQEKLKYLDQIDDVYVSLYANQRLSESPPDQRKDKAKPRPERFISPSTVNKELNTLNKLRRRAKKTWKVRAPQFDISDHKLKERPKIHFSYTVEEIGYVMLESAPHLREQILHILRTACRRGGLKLKGKNCNMPQRQFEWVNKGKFHVVPMTDNAYEELKARWPIGPEEPIYPYGGEEIVTSSKTALINAIRRAEIKHGVRGRPRGKLFHVFRETAATWMAEEDAHMRTIQKILGHSKITTTQIYTDASEKMKKEGIDKLAPRLRPVEEIARNLKVGK